MAAKRKKSNAAKKRAKAKAQIIENMQNRLLQKLLDLADGMTYACMLTKHIAFYQTCNPAEQEYLRKVFKEQEDGDLTRAVTG